MSNSTRGQARQKLTADTAKELESVGVLVHDDSRLRSRFFDGRFLTAKDLTREQAYFLTRQADLGRAGGVGVVRGLRVGEGADGRSIAISAGHGVTPSGEIVVLSAGLSNLRFDDIPTIERLDAAFGLSRTPREPMRNRSGLFVLALRPVEYTANPIASYPTALGGARTVQDGDIIEAVAITLIPYPDQAAGVSLEAQRARAAHDIFVRNAAPRSPVDALPLAMVALERGIPKWIDEFLVRREVGSEQADFLGMGTVPRAIREAHLQQYKLHLREVLEDRKALGQSTRILAGEHFLALPAAGPLPLSTIDPMNLTEAYFPPEVDVELAVVPEDELGALLEESLFLPPIDLTHTGEDLQSTSVVVLVPVPRKKMNDALALLMNAGTTNGAQGTLPLRSSAPGILARRSPLQALGALTQKWAAASPTVGSGLADAAWKSMVGGADMLWYARRKNFPYKPEIIGLPLPKVKGEVSATDAPMQLASTLKSMGLLTHFVLLQRRTNVIDFLRVFTALTKFNDPERKIVLPAVLGEISRLAEIRIEDIEKISTEYGDVKGFGLARIQGPLNNNQLFWSSIYKCSVVPKLDAKVGALVDPNLDKALKAIVSGLNKGESLDVIYETVFG